MTRIDWHRVPGPVVELLRRIKAVEDRPDGWSDAVAADTVTTWFLDQGVDPSVPAEQIPSADDEPHVYQRLLLVSCTSSWPLDQDDLDGALAETVNGIGVRVEHADMAETFWTELRVQDVRAVPPR